MTICAPRIRVLDTTQYVPELGTRVGPQPERAVDVDPRIMLAREWDELLECVEHTGVDVARLEQDDRWRACALGESVCQALAAQAARVVGSEIGDVVAAEA